MSHIDPLLEVVAVAIEGMEDHTRIDSSRSIRIVDQQGDTYIIERDGINHEVRILYTDDEHKKRVVQVDGVPFTTHIKTHLDHTIKQMGYASKSSGKDKDIYAPMPGLVLNISCQAGDEIKSGDTLLTLEAMKMENLIKATGDGIVETIHIKSGDKVEKGSILIKLA